MSDMPDWLPEIVCLADHGGQWEAYIEAVFSIFHRDFIQMHPRLRGCPVTCRRDPVFDGKEAGFWHCVSEGKDEANRIPDLRRCERIGWIRAVIENPSAPQVEMWRCRKNRGWRTYLWLNESYLIVLGDRHRYYQLITAFCTDRGHTIRRLRAKRDRCRNS